jgi:hypothetical protein
LRADCGGDVRRVVVSVVNWGRSGRRKGGGDDPVLLAPLVPNALGAGADVGVEGHVGVGDLDFDGGLLDGGEEKRRLVGPCPTRAALGLRSDETRGTLTCAGR